MSDEYNNYYNTEDNQTANVSEPYRYRYVNGEKTEQTAYHTYTYETPKAVEPKKKKPFLKAVKFLAGAACFGVIAGAAALGTVHFGGEALGIEFASPDAASGNVGGKGTPLNVTLGTADIIQGAKEPAESVVVQVVEENMAATVAVRSTYLTTTSFFGQYYQKEAQASGSGFIVGMNDKELLIATNNHVIDSATKIEITFIDETVLEATVKGTDTVADLAIVAVPLESISAETISKIRVATLGDSDEVRLGEKAIAIGNALGYGQSVTVGYISAKDRIVSVDGNNMVLLQTDAAINGGNSGGPLFNTKGEVIGINSVKYADTEVEGMCFAIPISRAIPILNELMNRETLADEEKGVLGISVRTVTEDFASFYGWPIGAYVTEVMPGSPAETAGLYLKDIITSVNGIQITTGDQLVSVISSYRHGATVELTIQRIINGEYTEMTISVTLAKRADIETETESNEKPGISELPESGAKNAPSDKNR